MAQNLTPIPLPHGPRPALLAHWHAQWGRAEPTMAAAEARSGGSGRAFVLPEDWIESALPYKISSGIFTLFTGDTHRAGWH